MDYFKYSLESKSNPLQKIGGISFIERIVMIIIENCNKYETTGEHGGKMLMRKRKNKRKKEDSGPSTKGNKLISGFISFSFSLSLVIIW